MFSICHWQSKILSASRSSSLAQPGKALPFFLSLKSIHFSHATNQDSPAFGTPLIKGGRGDRCNGSITNIFQIGITALSSTVLFAAQAPAAAQANGRDIQGHWAERCIETLAQKNIITASSDGLFRPDAAVSKAEYAVTVRRVFPSLSSVRAPIRFRDVRSDHWAASAIQYIQQTGFLIGDRTDEFRPGDKIVRSHALGGLASGLRYTAKQSASKDLRAAFKDGRKVPDYAHGAIAAALENRLLINYPDVKRLNPNQPLSRAEFAAALCQAQPSTASLVPTQFIASLSNLIANPSPVGTKPNPPGSVVVPVVSSSGGNPPGNINPGKPVSTQNPGNSSGGPIIIPGPETGTIEQPPRIPTEEIRAAWLTNIDSYVLLNPRLLQEAMQELARLRFNTVYPVVWNWGYTQYSSPVARRVIGHAIDPRPSGLRGRDPLAELVQQGRQHNITVIPWFEFGFMAPADSELAARYPEWLTQRQDGSTIWQEGQYQRVWLNPFKPEVQQFILDLIMEVVTKYGVDGIQFDDHMGLPSDFGYDAYTVELYKKEHGKVPPTNSKDPEWLRWRAAKLTEFMGRVHQTIKARKPFATVSLSPNSQRFSYENYLQDWYTWQRLGYVEEILLQVYRSDLNSFVNELMQPEVQEARKQIPVGIGILTGLKGKPVPIARIQEQIQAARNNGFVGVSFFFYETMWNLSNESPEFRKAAFRELFAPRVTRPSVVGGWVPQP